RQAVNKPAPGLRLVDLRCHGVFGLRFDLPSALDETWEVILQTLGLLTSRTLEVWPAGRPSAFWDDEGRAEWLMGQDIVIALRVDHSIQSLSLELDGNHQSVDGRTTNGNGILFINLG